jgi:alkanesulfonate monooxygenase SsuD/methylene tetrahydromethanopterin reductase-like flavin-dependent oxidoreductase (luciferase family)
MGASEGYSDPWTALAAIAVKTERIRIGTWITPIPNKLPWRFAHITASLDQLSAGSSTGPQGEEARGSVKEE